MPCVLTDRQLDALVAATALSLYTYNRSPLERAQRIYDFFGGVCADIQDIGRILTNQNGAFIMTELPAGLAAVYLLNALEQYEGEARIRTLTNLAGNNFVSAPE